MMRDLNITQNITNKESRAVEAYLGELGRLRLISADEEIDLAKRIRQGDHAALDRLVQANLRFVVSVAKKYQHQGIPLSDLISEGNLGLIQAARKFDETRGFKFISYAVWWIRQSILAALTEHSRMIRLPMNKINDISKLNKAVAEMEQELCHRPSAAQLAGFLRMTTEKVDGILAAAPRVSSLDNPFGEDDDYSPYDRLCLHGEPTDGALMAEDAQLEIRLILQKLNERERSVIDMSFGLTGGSEIPPEDIAVRLGLTRERVRQIRKAAIRKLRNSKQID
ncbi:sigma-70 family RNA polymerase sigma factor [Mucilaginibacter sp. SMC90]|uniref:sigma-70 family RNA polymerase sigma factor n=1 Tax=Mucilaginibacter sp. SMC90 TaxID=2929803 RepID=UPI001FB1ECB4|nr:sigma-70 family RNA polymerase sigma factor [Mucilaginibacter sp. SMC90]UOE51002.1 sigma-70 family RNA polymerase sigma factor [Mucilaginibacter sp. SMC90]